MKRLPVDIVISISSYFSSKCYAAFTATSPENNRILAKAQFPCARLALDRLTEKYSTIYRFRKLVIFASKPNRYLFPMLQAAHFHSLEIHSWGHINVCHTNTDTITIPNIPGLVNLQLNCVGILVSIDFPASLRELTFRGDPDQILPDLSYLNIETFRTNYDIIDTKRLPASLTTLECRFMSSINHPLPNLTKLYCAYPPMRMENLPNLRIWSGEIEINDGKKIARALKLDTVYPVSLYGPLPPQIKVINMFRFDRRTHDWPKIPSNFVEQSDCIYVKI